MKEVKLSLRSNNRDDVVQSSIVFTYRIYDLGYHTPDDFIIKYDNYEFSDGMLAITLKVKNLTMMQDQELKELLLEYMI